VLSHFRAVCAAIVAAAALIIAANTGPARAAEPHHAGPLSQEAAGASEPAVSGLFPPLTPK
jgi:hypothetical protein